MKGLIIWITDTGSDETLLDELGREIADRGGRVEVLHREATGSMGMDVSDEASKAAACAMIARHGVVVVTTGGESPALDCGDEIEVRRIPASELAGDLAHGEFMRSLELAGLVPPPKHDVDPDEEEGILEKLRDLGYLE